MNQLDETDDKVLWQNFKTGDKQSFNNLFRRYYSELYYFGIKRFPYQDIVKDSIQEVFIRIWETRGCLSDVQNVKSYLIVCLRRNIIAHNAKNKKKVNVEIGQAENYSFFFDVNEFEKHEKISTEIRHVLLLAINSMTKQQRELILLFFYHKLNYSEIAQVMEISIPAVRNLMYRSLIHLRESIGEKSLNSMKNLFFLLFLTLSVKKEK